ncbi:hypothetical protein B0H19DRAFT_1193385 [Mycena capillaripes]|nr:hypothetical protein B0H19DRAFT_1193385 [Mycena capillaripes]
MLFFLDGHPESAANIVDDDAILLCHLAPLAKAYEFNMYIGRLVYTESCKKEVAHEYKEYYEDIDISELDMDDDPDVDYNWDKLCTLGGVPVTQPALLALATRLVKTDLQDDLIDLDHEEDVEGYDESSYYSTMIYSHIRTASILFITP